MAAPSLVSLLWFLGLALAGNFNLVNADELFALVNIEPGDFRKAIRRIR